MNPNKTVSANSKGINISFTDKNKHKFVYYTDKRTKSESPRYQVYDCPEFNELQNKIFMQTIYGISYFKSEDVMTMSEDKIREIKSISIRAKYIINNFKQEVVYKKVDALMLKLFPKSPITKAFINTKGVDPSLECIVKADDLKLSNTLIAKRLMEEKLLPENFFNLV